MWRKRFVNGKTAAFFISVTFILFIVQQHHAQAGDQPLLTPSFFPFVANQPTLTPTATPDPNVTATPTSTPKPQATPIIQEEIDPMSLSKATLGQDEIHAWPFMLYVSEVVTITAVTTANTNLRLSLVDESETTLVETVADSGQVATIGQFTLLDIGSYQIHVRTEDGSPAEYVMMLLFSDSLNFIFQPIIAYGGMEAVNLPSFSEHFWHFAGSVGDQILITAVPDSNTDVFLELYGPNADRISAPFISVGTEGVTEELEFSLPENGLYSIRVGEWDFAAGSYELTLIEN